MDFEHPQRGQKSGQETLELFSHAPHFNKWLFEQVAPFCGGRILEIGSGIGNISAFLLDKFSQVSLSDVQQHYCDLLAQRFNLKPSLEKITQLDLADPDIEATHADLVGQFNTVVALNVVEHIEDDGLAIRNANALLMPGGKMVVLVPAYERLYNRFDAELGHYRRYSRESLIRLMKSQGLTVMHTRYFNAAAIPGWWFSGTILKYKMVPAAQLKIFNALVPFFRMADKLTGNNVGVSVIAVAQKN